MAHNVMVKATPLRNVKGRIDYISNPKRQEHLVATYSSTNDPSFWKELAEHCQEQTKYSKKKNAVEAREHMVVFSNELSQMDPDVLAKKVSDIYKQITGTENKVAIHWNKTHTNYHCHVIFAENKEINLVKESTTYDRNTYFDANGKRSYKKLCRDENGELLPGCTFYKKGSKKVVVQRFGNKLSDDRKQWLETAKLEVSKMQNELLQEERFKVFKDDGLHIPQQHVGNKIQDEELKKRIENKNKLIQNYNDKVDSILDLSSKLNKNHPELHEKWVDKLKDFRKSLKKIVQSKGYESWKNALNNFVERLKELLRGMEEEWDKRKQIAAKMAEKGQNEPNTRTSLTDRLQDIESRKGFAVPTNKPFKHKSENLER